MLSSNNEAPAATPRVGRRWECGGQAQRAHKRRFDFSASGRSADLIQFLGGGRAFPWARPRRLAGSHGRADFVRATLPQGDNAKLSPAGTPQNDSVPTARL
ncbi:hypothetical protein MTO96_023242 [Rhipicephalus appendiculatus]